MSLNIFNKKIQKNRLIIELEYLKFLNKKNICNIPESLIENITNNFSKSDDAHKYENISEFIKSNLPINLSPFVSFGIDNNSMQYISSIIYINSIRESINNNISKICYTIKKYVDKFLESNNFKSSIINNVNLIEKYKLDKIQYINTDLNVNMFVNYITNNKIFDYYHFLNNYGIKYSENIELGDVHNYVSKILFLVSKINIIITDLYNFNTINNINSYYLNEIKLILIFLKKNISVANDNYEYNSFSFMPIFLENLNYALTLFNSKLEKNNDSELLESLKKILLVNNIPIDKNLFFNKNISDYKEIINTLNLDNDLKEFIFENIFNVSIKNINKITENINENNNCKISRLGLWNSFWSSRVKKKGKECNISIHCKDIIFNNNVKNIEDWGCGQAKIKNLLNNIKYIGIDGSETGFQDKIEDLVEYKSNVECIYMKHVLEHNTEWKKILINLIESFQKIAIIIIHTPFQDKTKVLGNSLNEINTYGYSVNIEKIGFSKFDLENIFKKFNLRYSFNNIESNNEYKNDNIILIKK